MACRFPGSASTPDRYWQLLKDEEDAVSEIGPERWSTDYYFHPDARAPGKSYTFSAGILPDVDRFDARFFGISPREAAQMDPQQRILLELAWEALEDGGQLPDQLTGTDCSVFIGVSATDYANSRLDDPSSSDAYVMTGGTLSIASNRISYLFDLHGPSMSIDTACSSSLVALHQACQSIWSGESSASLAGGVNVLLTPFSFIGFAKASMLAADGRCRAFDANGSGYVRSEGGALVFLKPLSRARADGDRIHAVICASGANSDGRTKGLSMPNPDAQERLLRRVYAQAQINPSDLTYIEAHGTGTAAGDPQEASSIGRALGSVREDGSKLLIGSAKTNVGHLEPASGMAGVVKAVLSLEHRAIPASLHFDTPNPDIPFDDLNLEVVTRYTPMPDNGAPAVVGVNSFGFGGANAHVVLREHHQPRNPSRPTPRRGTFPLFLSARSEDALKALAGSYVELLADLDPPSVYDLAYASLHQRQMHEHRVAILAKNPDELSRRLDDYVSQGRGPGIVAGKAPESSGLALVFSGNGSQWPGMGRKLLAGDAVFRRKVHEVDELLRGLGGCSVVAAFRASPADSADFGLHLTEIAQPALFALQVGVLESMLARGLQPGAVLGHSVGEVAAAYAAGALTLEQGVKVIFERSAAQSPTRGLGRMAAAGIPCEEAMALIEQCESDIEIAAVNSPGSVTLSGPLPALKELRLWVEERGMFFRILDLDYAFHSRVMDPIRDGLVRELDGLTPGPTRIPFVSTVTGRLIEGEELTPDYWWRNVRRPVQLSAAIGRLSEDGFKVFLEIGPHPIMQSYVRETLRRSSSANESASKSASKSPNKSGGQSAITLTRDADGPPAVWEALCRTHVLGAPLDTGKIFRRRGPFVSLPTYPWQRESYWFDTTNERLGLLGAPSDHPLLGCPVAHADAVWDNVLDLDRFPYLADHVVGGAVVFPASGFIEMALAASALRFPDAEAHEVETLEIRAPLLLAVGETKTTRLTVLEDGSFTIKSRMRLSDQGWTPNVTGRLAGACLRAAPADVNVRRGMGARAQRVGGVEHYRRTTAIGLDYGPAFQGVAEVRVAKDATFARLEAHPRSAARSSPTICIPVSSIPVYRCWRMLARRIPAPRWRSASDQSVSCPIRSAALSIEAADRISPTAG